MLILVSYPIEGALYSAARRENIAKVRDTIQQLKKEERNSTTKFMAPYLLAAEIMPAPEDVVQYRIAYWKRGCRVVPTQLWVCGGSRCPGVQAEIVFAQEQGIPIERI